MSEKLTERQLRFIDAFIKDPNATSAAKSAGYSDASAHVRGSELRKHPLVAAEIARLTVDNRKNAELTADLVTNTVATLVDYEITDIFTNEGKLKPLNEIPERARRAIQSVTDKGVKLYSRHAAAELGAKLLGMVKEQQTQQTAVQIVISAPPELPKVAPNVGQLLPEWD
jgi:hypothetical protein